MKFGYNSTIAKKLKPCASCGKPCYWFSNKRCQDCARIEDTQKRMEEATEAEIKEEDLTGLIDDADAIFSQYVRLSSADKDGYIHCFICGKRVHWKEAQNMHYIKRGASLYLRHDIRNNKAGCKHCNETLGGNYIEYAKKLEAHSPGITDVLFQEGNSYYKVSREELKTVISEYTPKVKELLKKLNK